MSERAARTSVVLAALWLVGVSAIKLFLGTPASLPPFFRDGWLGPDLNFRLSITVELAIGLSALVAPRLGWLPLAALYAVFLAVLASLAASGAESCGCFGGALSFPPWLMLAIDGPLLAFLLAARPWRALPARRPPWIALATALVTAGAAPWLVLGPRTGSPSGEAPTGRPRYVVLEPETWVGKSVHESGLAPWLDTRALPGDATWILYRVDCDHCREVLRELARRFADDPRVYVFVALRERGDEQRRVVEEFPPGEFAELPEDILWHLTPPWELTLEGEVVRAAVDLSAP